MEKQYAVLHIEKGSGVGGGIGHHIDRTLGKEYTFPHADPKRLHLNRDFTSEEFKHKTVPEAVAYRIKTGYKSKRKIRDNTVKYLSTVLTGTHEQMIAIEKNGKLQDWILDNLEFMEQKFGKENIIRFVLHLDEKTPHIHCVHVPLTADGRLSAKEVMGDRTKLRKLQDDYSIKMKPYQLERGERRQGIHHETAQEYYRRINLTEDFVRNLNVQQLFENKAEDSTKKINSLLKTFISAQEKDDIALKREQNAREIAEGKIIKLQNKIKMMVEDAEFYQMVKTVEKAKQRDINQIHNESRLKK